MKLARLASLLALALPLWLACAAMPATAGQACGEKPATAEGSAKSARLSEQVRQLLDGQKHTFALVARTDADLSEFGLRHSHVGVAWRDHPRGRWYTFHLLNRCGTDQSELIEQSLEDFYNVELHDYEALIAAPSFPMQTRLQKAFFNPMAQTLHDREYSLIAHPFSTKYQNSNQWVLEVMAFALAPVGYVGSRLSAQDWLKENGYVPDMIAIGAGKRAGAPLFSPHVRFSDHTDEEWQAQRYAIVGVDSVIAFVRAKDRGLTEARLRLESPTKPNN
jgi:hypothetical protein